MSDKKQKTGLKFSNETSSVAKPNNQSTSEFNKAADAAIYNMEDYNRRALELTTLFKSSIEDTILINNKSPISINLEKDTIDKLVVLASEMNADENQPESIGSTALCMLLMKCMLIQRNIINNMAFKLDKLDKHVHDKSKKPEDNK